MSQESPTDPKVVDVRMQGMVDTIASPDSSPTIKDIPQSRLAQIAKEQVGDLVVPGQDTHLIYDSSSQEYITMFDPNNPEHVKSFSKVNTFLLSINPDSMNSDQMDQLKSIMLQPQSANILVSTLDIRLNREAIDQHDYKKYSAIMELALQKSFISNPAMNGNLDLAYVYSDNQDKYLTRGSLKQSAPEAQAPDVRIWGSPEDSTEQ